MDREKVYCFRCGTELEEEKELDYPYYCPECDENMYTFESITKKGGKHEYNGTK